MSNVLKVEEVSKKLNVSKGYVYKMVKNGKLN